MTTEPDTPDELLRKFRRCTISRGDFEQAHEYLDCLLNPHDALVRRALLSSAVIAYSRPFSANRAGEKALVSNKLPFDVGELLSLEELALHRKVLECRSRGIAHSDAELNPTDRVPRRDSAVMSWSVPFDVMNQKIDISSFKSLAWRLVAECITRQEIFDNQLRQLNEEHQSGSIPLAQGATTRLTVKLNAFRKTKHTPEEEG